VALPTTTTTRPGTTTTTKAGPGTGANGTGDGTLPVTGNDSHTLWIEILAGLLMIQLGLLFWTISQRPRFRKAD